MCGIYFSLQHTSCEHKECKTRIYESHIKHLLEARGPDSTSTIQNPNVNGWDVFAAGAVLWMQGKLLTKQPHVDSDGNILLWNGDVFYGPLVASGGSSDTLAVANSLQKCETVDDIITTIGKIGGPFSFVYLNVQRQQLWFGRDILGRHSLLSYKCKDNHLIITSVANRNLECYEVPAVGIFLLDLSDEVLNAVRLFPWSGISGTLLAAALDVYHLSAITEEHILKLPQLKKDSDVISLPYALLFDLFNKPSENVKKTFMTLLEDETVSANVDKLINLLKLSVQVRCEKTCQLCRNCVKMLDSKCSHSKFGILFSGGLDSTVIAAIAQEFVPIDDPIDLINVAFEPKKRTHAINNVQNKMADLNINYNVPDRKTGIQACKQLQSLYPERKWNFIQIDVTRDEMRNRCFDRISDLIHPLKTILDESLGCAVWFASKGEGKLNVDDKIVHYSSPARVLFLGMGADEQLGGYRRHRSALKKGGWAALKEMLYCDTVNISSRNMGRDDRVVADHGCQGRFPFLDERVVSFLASLQPWEKCFPVDSCPPGVGDKLLLRLAAFRLGLGDVASYPKRAMQFGSRIADSKENGNAISCYLQTDRTSS